jgi:cation transport regulator ChaC
MEVAMHYFAYGTLLDIDYMRQFCPSARAVGVMRLDGYELGFARCADPSRGGCTLDAAPDGTVWGVQYELSDEDMAKLDEASGVPKGHWARKRVTVRDAAGNRVDTTTYVIPERSGPYAPSDSYVAPILKGAAAFDLPTRYIARLRQLVQAAEGGGRKPPMAPPKP